MKNNNSLKISHISCTFLSFPKMYCNLHGHSLAHRVKICKNRENQYLVDLDSTVNNTVAVN